MMKKKKKEKNTINARIKHGMKERRKNMKKSRMNNNEK